MYTSTIKTPYIFRILNRFKCSFRVIFRKPTNLRGPTPQFYHHPFLRRLVVGHRTFQRTDASVLGFQFP